MPRKYDFEKPIKNDLITPYAQLPETQSHPLDCNVGAYNCAQLRIADPHAHNGIGHYRLDIPEPGAYSGLNEYLDAAYDWLGKNCEHHFQWYEGRSTEINPLSMSNGLKHTEIMRLSIAILFISEYDALKFENAFRRHNFFKKSHSTLGNKPIPFAIEEGIKDTFIRHAMKWIPALPTKEKNNPVPALPAPNILKIK